MAADLSVRRGDLAAASRDRLRSLLERAGLPTTQPKLGADCYRQLMGRDKKIVDGAMRFVLLRGLSNAYVTVDVRERDIDAVLA